MSILDRISAALDRASSCPACGCGTGHWREDCDCTRRDCECGGYHGPDTDFDDTFDYMPPEGQAKPVRGKWWLRGKCSLQCADVNCPPYGACQREERYEADQLPPASFPWLNGPPPLREEDRAMPEIPPEPPIGTVLETRDRIATYRIERLPEGWAIQYRPGEDEFGATHTSGRISWESAWRAWGPPAGAEPFRPVSGGYDDCDPDREDLADDDLADEDYSPDIAPAANSLPPAAEPYQPAKPSTSPNTTPPARTAPTTGAAMTALHAVQDRWDQFLTWLFKGWGFEDSTYWAPERHRPDREYAARVDTALARQAGQQPDSPPPADEDTRTQPEPQNLDAIPSVDTQWVAGPKSTTWSTQHLEVDLGPEWCNCGWMAGAHSHDEAPELNVGKFQPPPSAGGAEPA